MSPRYRSHLEVDDGMDTARAMGARVIRSQTLGESIGCSECIELKLGEFNPEAFEHIDYTLKAAHERGLRLIFTLAGDCANCELSGPGECFKDEGPGGVKAFFTDPKVIARFETYVGALLNHKNSLTGLAYKDGPTILAWENCNVCGLFGAFTDLGANTAKCTGWVDTIGSFIACEHLRASGLPLYPRGPRSGPGYAVPVPLHLIGLIRPSCRHLSTSPQCGLYAMPSLCIFLHA